MHNSQHNNKERKLRITKKDQDVLRIIFKKDNKGKDDTCILTLDVTFVCFGVYESKTMNKKYNKALGATYGQRAVQLLSVTLVY